MHGYDIINVVNYSGIIEATSAPLRITLLLASKGVEA